jgi:6,7-dimethyl-8-ribityllumazine synthase
MIRSLWVYQVAKSAGDFNLLVRLFEELGTKGVPSCGSDGRSFAALSAPDTRLHFFSPTAPGFELPDLYIETVDPFRALAVAKELGFRIASDSSPHEVEKRGFRAELPGGTALVFGRAMPHLVWDKIETLAGSLSSRRKRFGIVVSRFNSFITDRLLQGSLDALLLSGANEADIQIVRVPGSFEIPSAARALAGTKKYHAIICLGCLLRGDTAHYDVIANEVTRGIGQSAQETGVPHAFGVLTCDTLEQAIERAGLKMGNQGFEAALAAVEMASLRAAIPRPKSASGKGSSKSKTSTARRKRKS